MEKERDEYIYIREDVARYFFLSPRITSLKKRDEEVAAIFQKTEGGGEQRSQYRSIIFVRNRAFPERRE